MSGQPSLFGLDLGLENFSLKIPNVPIFFPLGQKKIASDWVKKYPGQSRVGLLFTAGQKYARVGSGPITTMTSSQPRDMLEQYRHSHLSKRHEYIKIIVVENLNCQKINFFSLLNKLKGKKDLSNRWKMKRSCSEPFSPICAFSNQPRPTTAITPW